MTTDKADLHIYLPEELKERVQIAAIKRKLSLSEFVEQVLRLALTPVAVTPETHRIIERSGANVTVSDRDVSASPPTPKPSSGPKSRRRP
jgi:hypothetical protein